MFEPISARVIEIWNDLSEDGDLAITKFQLSGGSRQAGKVAIDLSFDGTPVEAGSEAPNVLSTGQRNALSLATYVPRATQDGSPFRFLVLDDPIHAFDVWRVRYLARLLVSLSAKYQIIVLTHDERLWQELRVLGQYVQHIQLVRSNHEPSAVSQRDVTSPGLGYLDELERVLNSEHDNPLGTEVISTR